MLEIGPHQLVHLSALVIESFAGGDHRVVLRVEIHVVQGFDIEQIIECRVIGGGQSIRRNAVENGKHGVRIDSDDFFSRR